VFYKQPQRGHEYEFLSQPRFESMEAARAERQRVIVELQTRADIYDSEVGGIHGPDVVHHYVGMSESQRELAQLRLGVIDEEPF
jgi:hypothetical protein